MDQELVDICEEIFANIISQLTMHLRFMDIALDNFIRVPESTNIECDGTYLYYQPIYVIKTYKNNPNALTRGYLHLVLHSVFRHQFLTFQCDSKLWNLACDIAVENMIDELNLECTHVDYLDEQQKEIEKIKSHLSLLTAQKIYHYLKEELNSDQIKWLNSLFTFDEHGRWYNLRKTTNRNTQLFGEESKDDSTKQGQNQFDNANHDSDGSTNHTSETSTDELSSQDIKKIKESMKQWQEISEKIETDLQTFSKDYASIAGTMVQSLTRLNREKYNYSTFLKKFMTIGEKQMINEDEFDYIYYTLGLALYKNMPLIEPLEYKETTSIKNFVIAIDTSGSVSGPIVQSFLQKTYNIFQQKENFFNRFNIHIIECDTMIQDDTKLSTLSDFDRYIENIELKGFGGTDFRAIFTYLDELLYKKEFDRIDGLIYFTDGDGQYPKIQPSYKTAFVFLEEPQNVKVPAWAIQYVLNENDIYMED